MIIDKEGRATFNENRSEDPEGDFLSKPLICFIDTDYKELFKIPNGESLHVIYPPIDRRDVNERLQAFKCEFVDESRVKIGGSVYNIHQHAAILECIGARCEPAKQLHNVQLYPYTSGEGKFYSRNREEGNTCVGSLHGNFGNDGKRYSSSWNESDNGLYNAEIQSELQSVVYALRKDILKDRASMLAYCENNPDAKLSDGKGFDNMDYAAYGFKLETEKRQYFVNCSTQDSNGNFLVFAYADKSVPALERESSKNINSNQSADNKQVLT